MAIKDLTTEQRNPASMHIDTVSTAEMVKIMNEEDKKVAIAVGTQDAQIAKAIDGVYDSDPKTNPNAKKYDEVSIEEVVDKKLAVVDLTASIMSLENRMPMYVFGLNEENSIVNAVTGKFSGTKVTV